MSCRLDFAERCFITPNGPAIARGYYLGPLVHWICQTRRTRTDGSVYFHVAHAILGDTATNSITHQMSDPCVFAQFAWFRHAYAIDKTLTLVLESKHEEPVLERNCGNICKPGAYCTQDGFHSMRAQVRRHSVVSRHNVA